ncbi:MAG TPA: hypothetical protein VGQ82_06780 [Chthoniobacterales bacterium]|nr:hypothetical protein [Chthoniobacterales bacterium]
MKVGLVLLWIAAVALLPGCSPTVKSFDGKQLHLKHYDFIARYSGTDGVIQLSCGRRTADREGCLRGASIQFPELGKSCYGNWWLKKQDGEWQIVIEWHKDQEILPHCIRLPDSDFFKTAEFR